MSDLISREALLESFNKLAYTTKPNWMIDLIANAPAIEQGEAVTKLWESLGRWSAYLTSNGEQAELSPPSWLMDAVKNATTPQQPQSVDDALEEAVAIYQVYIEADGWMDFSKEQYEGFASWVHKRILYTTPQHPLSVADALEEAIKLIQKYGSRVANPSASIVLAIRALIKRNAEGVESDDLKDAKRYRWLREVSRDPDADKPHCVITKEVLEKGNPARMVSYLKFDEALDAEIDRAIAVKEGE